MMNEKNYTCIMASKESMAKIVELGKNDLKVTNGYNTAKAMSAIAEKFMADFDDVDPHWTENKDAATEAEAEAEESNIVEETDESENSEQIVHVPVTVKEIVLDNRLIQNHTVALDVHLDGKVNWDEIESFCSTWDHPYDIMDKFCEILDRNDITYRQRYLRRFVVEMKDLSKFIAITQTIHARVTVILNIINGFGVLAHGEIMGYVESELRENGIECHTVNSNPYDGSLFIDFSDINEAVRIIYGSFNIPDVEAELM